jgi:hypothetical protein
MDDEQEIKDILMDLAEGMHRLARAVELILEKLDDEKSENV